MLLEANACSYMLLHAFEQTPVTTYTHTLRCGHLIWDGSI